MNAFLLIALVNAMSWVVSKFYPVKDLDWYKTAKSSIVPPGYVFSIVWTLLYSLAAVVLHRLLISPPSDIQRYGVILTVLLILTSYAFMPLFVEKEFLWSNAIILVCLLLASFTIVLLINYDQTSSLLLTPFVVWLIQALIFNAQIASVVK